MTYTPRPKPCYLDNLVSVKVVKNKKVWRSNDGKRFYTWDGLHGEIEVYDERGHHLGAADPVNGTFIKLASKGRRLYLK